MTNIWTDATGLLATVAPILAGAAGGPFAAVATTAIIGALGLAPDTPAAAIPAALASATPDQLLALKQADNAFRTTMRQLDVDMAKVTADDQANARVREISVRDHTPAILAYFLTAGFFALVCLMVFHSVPEPNAAAVNILLGTLGTAWIAAMGYFFGSTQGSKAKTEMLFQSSPPSSVSQQPAPVAQAIQIDTAQPHRPDAARGGPSPAPDQSDPGIAAAIDEATTVGKERARAVQ